MKAATEKPTSTIADEELLSDESSESEEEESKNGVGPFSVFRRNMNRQKRAVMKMLIDYGPPYTKFESGITILDECAQPEVSLYEIHSMLNNRVSPNFQDPEDYYNSPMHWCCRHAHLSVMKLLRRAKAKINVCNEFGQTPLHVLCMMVFPEIKKKLQQKAFLWMLSQGADIDLRDKAGYCPIDYAAINGHEFMVETLLSRGCSVLRKNRILVAPRESLLDLSNFRSREIISKRINEEESRLLKDSQMRDELKLKRDEERQLKKRHAQMEQKRQEGRANRIIAKAQAQQQYLEDQREMKLKQEADMLRRERDMDAKRFGDWKQDSSGRWNWNSTDGAVAKFDKNVILLSSKKLMLQLRKENDFDVCNSRWKNATGNELEIQWKRQDVFNVTELGEDMKDVKEQRKTHNEVIDSLNFRDENDDELVGEDLEGLI
jgi:ankyrin repeat protein